MAISDRLSQEDQAVVDRIAKLAQLVETAYNTNYKVVIYDKNNPMTVKPEVLNSSVRNFDKATIFEEVLRADLIRGKLGQMLAKGGSD